MKLEELNRRKAQLGIRVEWSEAEDREPIDFDIRDVQTDERYATVWGSEPWHDIQVDCDHPDHLIDWGDDTEMGECQICGAQCVWGWYPDGEGGQERDIQEWVKPGSVKEPADIGGVVKSELLYVQEDF